MYLVKLFFTSVLVLLLCLVTEAGNLKKIRKALEKGKFEKAEKVISKSLGKDSINPGVKYFLSVMLIRQDYVNRNVDSSWLWVNNAISDLELADAKDLKSLAKIQLDSQDMVALRRHVSGLAFQQARDLMTIPAFDHYLATYNDTDSYERATYIRDSLAYDVVLAKDTWQDYEGYFSAYPNAVFVPDARKRYQSLIFKDYTEDDKLSSYIQFLKDHPDTPFRKLAEEIIFTRSIRDHQWSSYQKFLYDYPKTHLRKRIGDILYYKSRSEDFWNLQEVLKLHTSPDSLQRMMALEEHILFPIYEGGKYGFMSVTGEKILRPQFQDIATYQLCGGLTSELLQVGDDLISRSGDVIIPNARNFEDLGGGIIVAGDQTRRLYYKSGHKISDFPVERAELFPEGLIAFQSEEKWGLMTPLGHQLLPPIYDMIRKQGDFLVLEEVDSFKVTNLSRITSGDEVNLLTFDDYEIIGDSLFQGFKGDEEGLWDKDLSVLIPLDTHAIYVNPNTSYVKDGAGYRLFDEDETALTGYRLKNLDANAGWIAVTEADKWLLMSKDSRNLLVFNELDSVKLINTSTAFLRKGDTLQLVFQNGKRQWLQKEDNVRLLSGPKADYLLYQSGTFVRVLDEYGATVIDGNYDEISLIADSTFRCKKRGKVGVLDKNGKELIPIKYDLVDESKGLIFLLKGTQIGCYDMQKNIMIPAVYDSRIFSFGSDHYKVKRAGKLGVIDTLNKFVVPAVYDELVNWNDTSLWAKEAGKWKLISLSHEVLLDDVDIFNRWFENDKEAYALIFKTGGFGLLGSKTGEILAPEFNDILNVGTDDDPIFFAEQHLKTASFFVATYFDKSGKSIRSQAYRPEEYDRIYCDQ